MHRDWKQRRASAEGRKIRKMIDEKHVDPKALERFRHISSNNMSLHIIGGNRETGVGS